MPLVIERLSDPSNRVRRRAAYALARDAGPDLPWQVAARALINERDPKTRAFMRGLLRAVLPVREGGRQPD